jgi:hypothetical protein
MTNKSLKNISLWASLQCILYSQINDFIYCTYDMIPNNFKCEIKFYFMTKKKQFGFSFIVHERNIIKDHEQILNNLLQECELNMKEKYKIILKKKVK